MTDEERRELARAIVDEMLGRLATRPANDTRIRERRRYHVDTTNVDPAAIEEARAERQRRGVR